MRGCQLNSGFELFRSTPPCRRSGFAEVYVRGTSYPDGFVRCCSNPSRHPDRFATHWSSGRASIGTRFDRTPAKRFYESVRGYRSPTGAAPRFWCARCRWLPNQNLYSTIRVDKFVEWIQLILSWATTQDLTDAEWEEITEYFPQGQNSGHHKRSSSTRHSISWTTTANGAPCRMIFRLIPQCIAFTAVPG